MDNATTPTRPISLILIAVTAILAGGFIGATTNAINGSVSPNYFRNVMGWDDVQQIWRACIAQGIFEGLIYGVFFAFVFTLVAGIVSRARCPYWYAAWHLLVMVLTIYGCWFLGGLIAMSLATLSPEFYRNTFFRVPDEFGLMLRYAWVGGSIWGAMFGSLLTLAIGSILFANHWKSRMVSEV
ncbi:MAG: hypothetical protein KDA78_00835 [Planctomycetaceae bacterium]|nr:hypothetical protein [Planctomycetaceae bacterium]